MLHQIHEAGKTGASLCPTPRPQSYRVLESKGSGENAKKGGLRKKHVSIFIV